MESQVYNDSNAFLKNRASSILDSSQTIPNGFFSLSDRVIIWSLDQNSAWEWVLNTLDECVFFISQDLFINMFSKTQISFGQIQILLQDLEEQKSLPGKPISNPKLLVSQIEIKIELELDLIITR